MALEPKWLWITLRFLFVLLLLLTLLLRRVLLDFLRPQTPALLPDTSQPPPPQTSALLPDTSQASCAKAVPMPLGQGVDNHPLMWYPSAPRPQCLHAPSDHAQFLCCPSAMTSCRLSYLMIESAFRIDDPQCGRVNLQMAVRLHDGHRGLYG